MGPADDIRAEAARLGFDAVRFTAARLPEAAGDALDGFLSQGYAGDMDWLTATRARRRSPERMWPDAATAIVLGVNYGPAGDPLAILRQRDRGGISVYAQNDDYHDVIKKRLKALARWIAGRFDAGVKGFRRYRAADGKAAGGAGRARLAGQAHQSGVARVRQLAVPRRDPDHPRPAAGTRRRSTIAARAGPASTSARPEPSRRPAGSMRGAASAISPSSTRGRSRATCGR